MLKNASMAVIRGMPARLFGAAERLASDSGRIDAIDRTFQSSGRTIAGYAISQPDPARAARDLVSAGLVSPDNPCAIALAEARADAPGRDMAHPEACAISIMKSSRDRIVKVKAAALGRRAAGKGIDAASAAVALEEISGAAWERGDEASARIAAAGFAESVLGARGRGRERERRGATLEM